MRCRYAEGAYNGVKQRTVGYGVTGAGSGSTTPTKEIRFRGQHSSFDHD